MTSDFGREDSAAPNGGGESVGGRRNLALVLAVTGVILMGVGVAGLLSGGEVAAEPAVATGSPSPSQSEAPTPTASSAPTPAESPAEDPTPSPEPTETPDTFFARFADAVRGGKPAFLLSRLHPFVFDRYAGADCRSYLGGLHLPKYDVEILKVGGTKVFHWETDGISRDVAHATTVRIRFTEDGDTFIETDTHLVARDDGSFSFLTDCGTPKAGAA